MNNNAGDGAGVYAGGDGSVVAGSTFDGNSAVNGAGVYINESDALVDNSSFVNNNAGDGAGVYVDGDGSVVAGSTFDGNSAVNGAGVYINGSDVSVNNSSFVNNNAVDGAGVYINGFNASVNASSFVNNTAVDGAGIYSGGNGSVIDNSSFINNTAERGSGVLVDENVITTVDNEFTANNTNTVSGSDVAYVPTIKASTSPVSADNDVVIEVNITNPNDMAPSGIVVATVNGKNYTANVSVVDGIAKAFVNIPDLDVGDNIVDIKYLGDDNFTSATVSVVARVDKIEDYALPVSAESIDYGDIEIIRVSLPCYAEDGDVIVIVNGVSYSAHVLRNMAHVGISDLPAGKYDVEVVFGNAVYATMSNYTSFVVNKVVPDISADNASVIRDYDYAVNVPDDAAGVVSVEIAGETYTSSVNNGVALFNTSNIPVGSYKIRIIYSGDNNYYAREITDELIIGDNMLVVSDNLTKYYTGSERFVVNVTRYDASPIADKTVYISINGVNYTKITNGAGSASLAINLLPGTYDVHVSVDNYSLNRVVVVLSTINSSDFTKVYKSGNAFYAGFFDGEGNYLPDASEVSFSINGVNYTRRVSGGEGLAKLNINLPVGEYVITTVNKVTGEYVFNTVRVISPIVNNHDLVKYYMNASAFAVQIIDSSFNPVGEGASVVFTVNGVSYIRQTDSTGWVRLGINLLPGEYVINTSYGGSDVFNKIVVLPVLSANDLTVAYGTRSRFEARVVDGQGNPYANQVVTFTVNGVSYDRVSGSDGVAGLNINLPAGEYIINSEYMGLNIANTIVV